MNIKHAQLAERSQLKSFVFKATSLNDDGEFVGYGSVFGVVDHGRDVIERGAFAESLAAHKAMGRMPAMLWQHDVRQPIGKYIEISEDERGLKVHGRLALKTARGSEAYELMKMDALSGLSIGYELKKDGYKWDNDAKVLRITKVDLWEVSLVTFPMNDEARVDAVKFRLQRGELPTARELEHFLRDAGFSKTQACAFIAEGYKALSRRDADEVAALSTSLDQFISTLNRGQS